MEIIIYLIGFIVAYILMRTIRRDFTENYTWTDVSINFVLSLGSWFVVALTIACFACALVMEGLLRVKPHWFEPRQKTKTKKPKTPPKWL